MAEITMLLGANLDDPHATFARATTLIEDRIGRVLASSRDHWTEPWGFQDNRLFLNRAIIVDSGMTPESIMKKLLAIELELGRERPADGQYAARTIDMDILFMGNLVLDTPHLTIPHPLVQQRAFALAPAADIVPALVHPVLGITVLDLLNEILRSGPGDETVKAKA